MAQIKMDVSEYEALKENKRLLEESLENERELRQENKKLQQEKIEALQEAKKKVVKTTMAHKSETIYAKRPIPEIVRNINFFAETGRFKEDYRTGGRFLNPEDFFELMFERKSIETEPIVSSVTTHGLDEIKEEIREQIKKDIDAETKEKIERYDEKVNKIIELQKKCDELINQFNTETRLCNEYQKTNEELQDEVKELMEMQDRLTKVKEELKDVSFWNANFKFLKIKNLTNFEPKKSKDV